MRYHLLNYLLPVLLTCLPALAGNSDNDANLAPREPRVYYGIASFYAAKFNGRPTANGEIYSDNKLTAACNILPLGTWIRVTNLKNNRSVIVKTNDRLHPRMKRIVDLSRSAAENLRYTSRGLTQVKVEVIEKHKALQQP